MENIETQKKELENKYEFVPCDVCDELVQFSEYNQHIRQHCNRYNNTSDLVQIINDIRDITNNIGISNRSLSETLSSNHLTSSSSSLSSISSSSRNVIREDISYNNIDTLNEDENSDTNSNGSSTSSVDEIATNQFFSNPNYIMPPQVESPAIHNILTEFSNTTYNIQYNNIENDVNNTASNRYNTLVQLLPTTHFDNSSGTYDYLRNLTAELGDVKVGVKDLSKISTIHLYSSNLTNECIICREDKTRFLEMNYCKHTFCGDCCNNWFSENKKCPICQKEYE